jgi:hypothetical protein
MTVMTVVVSPVLAYSHVFLNGSVTPWMAWITLGASAFTFIRLEQAREHVQRPLQSVIDRQLGVQRSEVTS